MRIIKLATCALVLNLIASLDAHGAAGDLKSPSFAMPTDTPEGLRHTSNLLAAVSEKDCKFLDGHFMNAHTTLNYGGSTEALNRLLARLGEFGWIRLEVTFVKEPDGPAWTLSHNGGGDPGEIFVRINMAAPTIQIEQLELTVIGHSKPP